MIKSDADNVTLVETADSVDHINAQFYGRFPYPWTPVKFDYLEDANFELTMLNQDFGDWEHRSVPRRPKIWVAGCGTNQAVFTALKFPTATVIGSDVSEKSLELCAQTASELGLGNLELRRESLNHVPYRDEFDYVICTGVIHHNAEPRDTLARLAAALKPEGIMELMVYNRFHWIIPVALQQAIRILCRSRDSLNLELELSVVKKILNDMPKHSTLVSTQNHFLRRSEEALADGLMQPVLHSYTVESLEEMAESCELELLVPCLNQFDKAAGNLSWNTHFDEPSLRELYESLPDSRRWQVTNLLSLQDGPQLWFYLQRKDSGRARKGERQICEEFLDTTFTRSSTVQRSYIRKDVGAYRLAQGALPFPLAAPKHELDKIFQAVDGERSMREIFRLLEIETDFETVNHVRLQLATSAFPYLKALPRVVKENGHGEANQELSETEKERRAQSSYQKFKSVAPRSLTGVEDQDKR